MNRVVRMNSWLASHIWVVAAVMTLWFGLDAWHLYVPHYLVTANGHLVDPSTTDPAGYNVYAYKNFAYSDIYRLYAERNLFGHPVPYLTAPIEYPVVTGLFMWVASLFHGANGDFVASAVGLWLAGIGTLFCLAKVAPKHYHWFAFSPLLFLFSLLNWDFLGIMFMVAGLWMASEDRWALAGVAFALGTCAKLFPIVYLPFLAIMLVKQGKRTHLSRLLISFVAVCLVVNVPFAVLAFHNWTIFFRFNATRGGAGILAFAGKSVMAQDALIATAVCIAIAIGARSVWRGGAPTRATVMVFVVFLLLNKVYSPQYTLWLFVMALIAQWPEWTLAVVTGTGAGYYFGTFATLYITNASVGVNQVTQWWGQLSNAWLNPFLYTGLVIAAVGAGLDGPMPDGDKRSSKDENAPGKPDAVPSSFGV